MCSAGTKRKRIEKDTCGFCHGDETRNDKGKAEVMLSCSECACKGTRSISGFLVLAHVAVRASLLLWYQVRQTDPNGSLEVCRVQGLRGLRR